MDKQLKLMIKNKTANILSNHIREMASKTDDMLKKWANEPSTRSTTRKKNNTETTPSSTRSSTHSSTRSSTRSSTHSSTRSSTRKKDTCGRSTVAINEEYRHNGKPCKKDEERTKNFCIKKIKSLNMNDVKWVRTVSPNKDTRITIACPKRSS